MKNIILRTTSGAVYIGLIISAILLLENSPYAYLALMSFFVALGMNEIYTMTRKEEHESWLIIMVDMLGGIGLFLTMYLMSKEEVSSQGMWLIPLASYLVVRFIIQLYRPKQNAVHSLTRSFFAIGYVALPLGMLNTIIAITAPRILLGIFAFIWINDTGAFLSGITLGKHKLFKRVSPKKSWEGFIGGVLLCIAAAYATHHWFNDFFQCPPLGIWIGLSIVVALAATFGDFTESLIKRTLEVKDSGKLIPGHGGILDRIDSLLLVAPATLVYLAIVVYNIKAFIH
ncbi:phosphatidate cytidylyltransferase [Sodaliphilus sp.]|uniref:phosphatidate cytidylyltransferase n=1 Tax=Sodaliphilus sp. TaxID=2815818 RepID=UPI003890C68D